MNRKTLTAIAIAIAFGAGLAIAQSDDRAEGFEPYSPPRIEWLAVSLNATAHWHAADFGYRLTFVATGPNTLTIDLRHGPTLTVETLNDVLKGTRAAVTMQAKRYGFEGWLEIEENVEALPE